MSITIRPEQDGDLSEIYEVQRLAFRGDAEAKLVDALREGGFGRVSLVAEHEGRIVGHIYFSELAIWTMTGRSIGLALAPLAVRPQQQRHGIGSKLVDAGLEACRKLDYGFVIVVGHKEYYPRFGFSADLARHLECAYKGPSFMALELKRGAISEIEGRVEYAPPFAVS